jgi:hypothetical protein
VVFEGRELPNKMKIGYIAYSIRFTPFLHCNATIANVMDTQQRDAPARRGALYLPKNIISASAQAKFPSVLIVGVLTRPTFLTLGCVCMLQGVLNRLSKLVL